MPRRTAQFLLICGVLAPVLHLVADLAVSWRAPEYSFTSQQVSELSAIDAPTRPIWAVIGFVYIALIIAFGAGVWLAAGARRALRITGVVLAATAALNLVWPPMHVRGTPATTTDTLHIVFAGATVLLMLVAFALAAASLGRRFRIYTIVTVLAVLAAGAVTGAVYAPRMAAGLPTPGAGLVERVNVYGYLAWIAVLAVTLWRAAPAVASSRRLRADRGPSTAPRGSPA